MILLIGRVKIDINSEGFTEGVSFRTKNLFFYIPYFLEISPHLELSPPSKFSRVVLTLNALNAALEFSPHVVKGRHYYCERVHIYAIY